MRKFFGTDGIRGRANVEPLTPPTLTRLGQAIGQCFMRGNYRHRVVIGKDTRLSGYMLEYALAAGFVSVGMDVVFVGPLPTPAIAMLTRSFRADLGVMISASHNPFSDNGIKLFDPDGCKLSDATERTIEEQLAKGPTPIQSPYLGQMMRMEDAVGRYIEFLKASLPRDLSLEGLRVVVDCANGSAYKVAPLILKELGATVVPLGFTPNGRNINKGCGSMHPEVMCAKVKEVKAHIGVAFDGDADRVVFADETAHLIEGDQILGLLASQWKRRGLLTKPAIVGSLMTNLGLETYLEAQGISLMRAAVGDRYITEKMREEGCNVGGEPSGHIVLSDYSTGGDGLLIALQVLALLVQAKIPASQLLHTFDLFPQILQNVAVSPKCLDFPAVKEVIESANQKLRENERLIIRPSGTEPLIRLMAEGKDKARLQVIVDEIHEALLQNAESS